MSEDFWKYVPVKGDKNRLKYLDENIARIKGYINDGVNCHHLLRSFVDERNRIANKIGRAK